MIPAPVLIVEHEAQCPPGWVGEWLAEVACPVDVRRPYAGEALPGQLDDHAGLLVLGGSMGAYDDEAHPWLPEVRELVRRAARHEVPTLGICLGHQLAAVALGGAVHVNPGGQQIGVLDVGWTPAAQDDPLFGGLTGARVATQWNNDIVSILPDGSEVLAQLPTGELQAARFAPTVWGVQWHPEAGEEIIRPWADNDRDAAAERGVDLDKYLDEVAAGRDELRAAWQPLATRFAELAQTPASRW